MQIRADSTSQGFLSYTHVEALRIFRYVDVYFFFLMFVLLDVSFEFVNWRLFRTWFVVLVEVLRCYCCVLYGCEKYLDEIVVLRENFGLLV